MLGLLLLLVLARTGCGASDPAASSELTCRLFPSCESCGCVPFPCVRGAGKVTS